MRSVRERLAAVVAHAPAATAASPASAAWTFPLMIFAAFVVAWGAEAAEFLMSQGLALAALALIQTLPEFAVEAVIAWKAGKNPPMVHLAIANFTGSLRLLTGLGWPMIYGVAAFYSIKKRKRRLGSIHLHDAHSVEVLGLLPPLVYFIVIWARRVTRAPVALMNMVSSNINQWGILSGLLAVIYCWSHGSTTPLPFDDFQRQEILLTILQALLGWIFLASMDLQAYEAAGLF